MRAVILAAGMGRRLGANRPKALVEFEDNYCFLDHQLFCLRQLDGVNDIVAVVGYRSGLFRRYRTFIRLVENPLFDSTNTSSSLLIGLQALRDLDEDVLVVEADVYFDVGVLERIASCEGSVVACRIAKCGDEEMKFLADQHGNIVAMSKSLSDYQGEAMGVAKFERVFLRSFVEHLKTIPQFEYWEFAVEGVCKKGKRVKVVDISDLYCTEVDFPEDLELLRQNLATCT